MTPKRIFLSRCQRLGACGFIGCICDVDPTNPQDVSAWRQEVGEPEPEKPQELFPQTKATWVRLVKSVRELMRSIISHAREQ